MVAREGPTSPRMRVGRPRRARGRLPAADRWRDLRASRFGRVDFAVVGTERLRRQFEHNGWTGRSPDIVSRPDTGTRTAEAIDPHVEALVTRSNELQGEA